MHLADLPAGAKFLNMVVWKEELIVLLDVGIYRLVNGKLVPIYVSKSTLIEKKEI